MSALRLEAIVMFAVVAGVAGAQAPATGPTLAHAAALVDQGRFGEAEKAIEVIVAAEPKSALAWNLFGRISAAEKKWAAAARHFARARDLKPADAVIRQNLGICHYEQGRADEARRDLAEATRLDPTLPLPHIYAGRLAQDAGDSAGAETAFRRAAALAPEDPWPLYFRGSLLFKEKRLEEAAAAFQACLEKSPDLPSAHWNLGLALVRLGKKDEGERHLQRFRTLSDVMIKDHRQRIRITSRIQGAQHELEAGRVDAALTMLLEALDLASDVPAVHLLLAEVYARQGRRDDSRKARAEFERLSGKRGG